MNTTFDSVSFVTVIWSVCVSHGCVLFYLTWMTLLYTMCPEKNDQNVFVMNIFIHQEELVATKKNKKT